MIMHSHCCIECHCMNILQFFLYSTIDGSFQILAILRIVAKNRSCTALVHINSCAFLLGKHL